VRLAQLVACGREDHLLRHDVVRGLPRVAARGDEPHPLELGQRSLGSEVDAARRGLEHRPGHGDAGRGQHHQQPPFVGCEVGEPQLHRTALAELLQQRRFVVHHPRVTAAREPAAVQGQPQHLQHEQR
jgi:hypothetical protein